MKVRNLVSKRFKETPADCVIASQALMMRGGYIKPVGNGIFTLFPIAKRITSKIEAIIREEMNRIDGQEVLFPVAMPAQLWRDSGRFDSIGSELLRFKDRSGQDMVLGMIPDPDQVPRRAPLPRRPDPRARVHHEGRLLLPHQPGGPGAVLHALLRGL